MLELVWISLACALTAMVVGMLWFGPFFSKPWLQAMGWADMSAEDLKQKQGTAGPGYAVSIVGAILGGLVLWLFFDASYTAWDQLGKAGFGVVLGLLVWVGFYVPATLTTCFFEGRNWTLWKIDAGYRFVVMGLWGLWVGLLHVA